MTQWYVRSFQLCSKPCVRNDFGSNPPVCFECFQLGRLPFERFIKNWAGKIHSLNTWNLSF